MKRLLAIPPLLLAAGLIWLPFWLLLSGSLMGQEELSQNLGPVLGELEGWANWPLLPAYPTLRPYVELLLDSPAFFVMFWNSVKQVVPILALQVLVGAPAAWSLAQYRFRGRQCIYFLYIALMLLPFQVTMVSNFLLLDRLGLMDTAWAIILPGAFNTFPVFIMTRFFSSVPHAILEAAALDGASPLRCFISIGLPLGAPGILSAVVLGFLEAWNALEQPLAFLQDKTLWPLSLYLPTVTMDTLGVSVAASMLMLTPALLIFLFGQPYLEQGITAAGLKE